MGETTISWTHTTTADGTAVPGYTFNGWIGCQKVSPACDGCYAEALMDKRYGRVQWGAPGAGNGTRVRTSEANWKKPLTWNRKAEKDGTRPFVFCSSLADVFDNQVPTAWRTDLFELIRRTPNLIWLLLTKRPQNILRLYGAAFDLPWPRNAAIGTTIEDQKRADINVPALLKAKGVLNPAFAFLSCEPLLGPIDLDKDGAYNEDSGASFLRPWGRNDWFSPGLDWVITGGETDQGDHKARPSDPAWFRSLRDQCAAAGIAYHHKQNGEWVSNEQMGGGWEYTRTKDGVRYGVLSEGGFESRLFGGRDFPTEYPWNTEGPGGWGPGACMVKVGKNNSGRLLDGREHNAFPAVA
ncbi:MAG: DUF5131 family protein [Mesorhizobium sp.]|nr:MAG: DUF5131 family protein [Mesorhizobium sp.]